MIPNIVTTATDVGSSTVLYITMSITIPVGCWNTKIVVLSGSQRGGGTFTPSVTFDPGGTYEAAFTQKATGGDSGGAYYVRSSAHYLDGPFVPGTYDIEVSWHSTFYTDWAFCKAWLLQNAKAGDTHVGVVDVTPPSPSYTAVPLNYFCAVMMVAIGEWETWNEQPLTLNSSGLTNTTYYPSNSSRPNYAWGNRSFSAFYVNTGYNWTDPVGDLIMACVKLVVAPVDSFGLNDGQKFGLNP